MSENVTGCQTLLKCVAEHLYRIFSSLWEKLSWKMSLLVISEILGKRGINRSIISKNRGINRGIINRKSFSSMDITAVTTCNYSQWVGKRKDNKRVFIVRDSIIKHFNGYVIGGKAGNCNVYVRPSHGAKVRCMLDHVKPIIRDKPDHIIFHVGTNDIPLDKYVADIAKSIVDLAISAKSPTCDVSISNTITRKDKHQHKAQIVNNHLKEIGTNKNINLIDHSKSIKHQHVNKSKLHLTKRGTNIISTTFVREISNIFQWKCFLCSTNGEVIGSSSLSGYKPNSKKFCTETNHLKSLKKSNLSRLIFAHLNVNSIRNTFEFLVKGLASNIDVLMILETKIDNSFPKGQFLIKDFCEPFRIERNCSMLGKIFRLNFFLLNI